MCIETVGRFHIAEFTAHGWSQAPTSLGRILACLRDARTLPPKAPHSSSEWPPGVSSPPVVPPGGEANLPTTSKSTEGLPETPAFLPHFLHSIPQPILFPLPSSPFLVSLHEHISISRNNRPGTTAHLPRPQLRRFPPLAISPTRWRPSPPPTTLSTRRRSI